MLYQFWKFNTPRNQKTPKNVQTTSFLRKISSKYIDNALYHALGYLSFFIEDPISRNVHNGDVLLNTRKPPKQNVSGIFLKFLMYN